MLINIKKAPLTIWSGALLKQVTKKISNLFSFIKRLELLSRFH